ncbi:MAG: hypothetical protein KCHDKBKB_00016 [Elusimicrobia bacterium]|nr:hypothetical protein [Elusimicrobiota bacterium]
MSPYTGPTFFVRFEREIKSVLIILAVLGFGVSYALLSPLKSVVDKGVIPAVEGITVLYGKISTGIYQVSRIDLGFVNPPPDQDFLFSVRLASYINEKRASPLLDIAGDPRFTEEKRIRALLAMLKFESAADWIQPFLNELPKGGLLGLYDEEAPYIDNLIKKIRAEGGIRQPLIRAYAEVVFAFMLQLPDVVVRRHAANWISDVVAEDAVFLLIPRFEKEKDPAGQLAIEKALFNIRAVSEPSTARTLLIPYYKNPPWPSLRLPVALVLLRLGHEGVASYLQNRLQSEETSKEERTLIRLAQTQPPYPRELKISDVEKKLLAERRKLREDQTRAAIEKRDQILRQELLKKLMLARAKVEEAKKKPVAPQSAVKVPPPSKSTSPKEVAKPKVDLATSKQAPTKTPSGTTSQTEKIPPKTFPIPGEKETEIAKVDQATTPEPIRSVDQQVASIPDDQLPPPDKIVPKSRSLMNYVDVIFEVKGQDVTLFQNPGDTPNGNVLPAGTKGKADFEVMIGEDKWYQVKTKKGSGWANGKFLSVFNLSPESITPAVGTKPSDSEGGMDQPRKESTYFEAAIEDVPTFEKPSEKAKIIGRLAEETPYMAIRSEKVGVDRWFLLQIRAGESAWARGFDLRLADVQQPVELTLPKEPLGIRGKKSAFEAEYVKATVKGVGVYSRPSITAKMIEQISPPTVYKILEMEAGAGKEWYRIQLPGNKEGYVQSMDVSLTKGE